MAKQTLSHILEQGKVYFFYRPKVSDEAVEEWIPKGIEDVQRFYMVLKSDQDAHYRLLIIGKKRLPALKKNEKYWGVVDMVTTRKHELINALKESHYQTKTRGEKVQPEVKECGEGRYYIVKHGKNTFLNYRLSLPKQTGKVQRVFQIAPIANYQISMKNQELAGVQGGRQAQFPQALKDKMILPRKAGHFTKRLFLLQN